MKFKLGHKASQIFISCILHSIAKARESLFSSSMKVGAYDSEEIHSLLHSFNYIFEAFGKTLSRLARMIEQSEDFNLPTILSLFKGYMEEQWQYLERDYMSFKEIKGEPK